MRYTVDRSDDAATLKLHEERLDATNSGDLKGELLILCSSGVEILFVDLSEVNFSDSAGLSAMLLVHREMKSVNGYAIFVGLTDRVKALVELAQLDRVLYIYPTREDALADLESGGDDDDDETTA